MGKYVTVQAFVMDVRDNRIQEPEFAASILPMFLPWVSRSVKLLPGGFNLIQNNGLVVNTCSVCKRAVLCESLKTGSHTSWCWYDCAYLLGDHNC